MVWPKTAVPGSPEHASLGTATIDSGMGKVTSTFSPCPCSGFKVQGSGCRVQGAGFRVHGSPSSRRKTDRQHLPCVFERKRGISAPFLLSKWPIGSAHNRMTLLRKPCGWERVWCRVEGFGFVVSGGGGSVRSTLACRCRGYITKFLPYNSCMGYHNHMCWL